MLGPQKASWTFALLLLLPTSFFFFFPLLHLAKLKSRYLSFSTLFFYKSHPFPSLILFLNFETCCNTCKFLFPLSSTLLSSRCNHHFCLTHYIDVFLICHLCGKSIRLANNISLFFFCSSCTFFCWCSAAVFSSAKRTACALVRCSVLLFFHVKK